MELISKPHTPWQRQLRGTMCVAVALAAALMHSAVAMGESRTPDLQHWRTPDRDGLNALYLFLSCCGAEASYDDLSASRKATTFADLKAIANDFSVATKIVQATPQAMTGRNLPAIVLMDLDGANRGSTFCVVVANGGKSVRLVQGGSVVMHDMSIDEFRRNWTGVAMIATPPSFRSGDWLWVLAGGVVWFSGRMIYSRVRKIEA